MKLTSLNFVINIDELGENGADMVLDKLEEKGYIIYSDPLFKRHESRMRERKFDGDITGLFMKRIYFQRNNLPPYIEVAIYERNEEHVIKFKSEGKNVPLEIIKEVMKNAEEVIKELLQQKRENDKIINNLKF